MDTALIITWQDGERVVLPDLPAAFGNDEFAAWTTCRELLPRLYSVQLVEQPKPHHHGKLIALWTRDEKQMRGLTPERFIKAARNAVREPPLRPFDDQLVDEHRRDQMPPGVDL